MGKQGFVHSLPFKRLMALAVGVCLWLNSWWRWAFGLLLLVLSARLSYGVLSAETTVIDKIRRKLFHRNEAATSKDSQDSQEAYDPS